MVELSDLSMPLSTRLVLLLVLANSFRALHHLRSKRRDGFLKNRRFMRGDRGFSAQKTENFGAVGLKKSSAGDLRSELLEEHLQCLKQPAAGRRKNLRKMDVPDISWTLVRGQLWALGGMAAMTSIWCTYRQIYKQRLDYEGW